MEMRGLQTFNKMQIHYFRKRQLLIKSLYRFCVLFPNHDIRPLEHLLHIPYVSQALLIIWKWKQQYPVYSYILIT